MGFVFEERPSNSPLVETIWRTESASDRSFISRATSRWEMVVTKQAGRTTLTVRGPETKASLAPIPRNAEFTGIVFRHGAFMPHLPAKDLVDEALDLPPATSASFWLHGSAWDFPTFDNADFFIRRLVREDLLVNDEIVAAALQDRRPQVSARSVQRHFIQATGLTQNAIWQIERALRAAELLQHGTPILDTIFRAGYYDQPHLTRSLKRFAGQTPAQIAAGEPGGA